MREKERERRKNKKSIRVKGERKVERHKEQKGEKK